MYFGTNQTFKIKLGGAVTTNQCPWVALAIDTAGAATPSNGVTNNGTDVTVVAATKGCLKWFWLRNADTVPVVVSVIYDDNATQRIFVVLTLQVGDVLEINSMGHMQIVSSAGVIRNGGGIGGVVGSVDNRLVRVDGTTGMIVQAGVDASLDDSGNLGLGLSGTMDRALQLGADKAARGAVKVVTYSSGATFNLAQGNDFYCELNGSDTLDFSNVAQGQKGVLQLKQGSGGSKIPSWAAKCLWENDTPPTLSTAAGATDLITYFTDQAGANVHLALYSKGSA